MAEIYVDGTVHLSDGSVPDRVRDGDDGKTYAPLPDMLLRSAIGLLDELYPIIPYYVQRPGYIHSICTRCFGASNDKAKFWRCTYVCADCISNICRRINSKQRALDKLLFRK